ncbi:ABC transporter permease [Streptomyces sp. 35G-GA-8]|uniref:ABC transporter permease n=1 Tax=Streptomyces sp. 35G-GA-8 TaxID=2939434 RepID=UPI00201FA777|nr:ABC transporter permease [Streptomyces sp. 35G-GA-8]MCL7376690.1 ABC transporter permease [Streptomyces sp. 35G-GA-8]
MTAPPPAGAGARRGFLTAALLAPAGLTVAGLVLVPLLLVVRDSFATPDLYGGTKGGFTLANYRSLFDPVYLKVFGYSLGMAALNAAVCLLLGYVVAYYLVSRAPQRQMLLLLLIIVPFWTDFLVRTFAWINLLSPGGPVNSLTDAVGLTHGPAQWIPGQGASFVGLVYAFLPTAVFPVYASLRGVDPALGEAARDLGCGWWRVHTKVLLPIARPGLLAAALLTFIPTLGVFVIPVLLGGGKNQLVGNLIVTLYTEFRNRPMGAAASVVLLVLMLVSLAVFGTAARHLRRKTA